MLGLLNPGRTDLKYRSLYSRCCQFQHLEYGVPSLLFHSFESVFLYAIAGDAGAVDTAKVPNQVCCRLRAGRRLEFAPDREVGRFCASFSLLAAETKSADALRDAPSLVAKTRDQLFQSRFRRARTYFSNLDTKFCSTFDGLIAEHLVLENSSSMPSLATYCRPTAAAFEYTFGLMAKILSGSDLKPLLERVGSSIGAAILAFDCARDWRRDQRDGQFNVVHDPAQAQRAIDCCFDRLAEAGHVCASTFGPTALSATVLKRVRDCIRARSSQTAVLQNLGAHGNSRSQKSVVLNATCCFPCGDGAVAVDSDECGKLFCGCCCLGVCAVSACEGRCC
jgi:hypothetical protein